MSETDVDKNKWVEIFTDGACSGNPGPGGWGALLRYGRHEKTISGYCPLTTNNRMELIAAIRALEALKRPCNAIITTDSKYLKNGITKWIKNWKLKGWRLDGDRGVKNSDLWKRLDELCQRHNVRWNWVRGHSGHRENAIVDHLARKAIKLGKKGKLEEDLLGSLEKGTLQTPSLKKS